MTTSCMMQLNRHNDGRSLRRLAVMSVVLFTSSLCYFSYSCESLQ